MAFTMEQIQKAMKASSAEELLAMAKEDGIEMTLTEAEEYYSELHQNYEMSDDDLQMVAGGKGVRVPYDEKAPQPRYRMYQRIKWGGQGATIVDKRLARYDWCDKVYWSYDVQFDDGRLFKDTDLEAYQNVEGLD